jgi:gliding motility-associated-like protein
MESIKPEYYSILYPMKRLLKCFKVLMPAEIKQSRKFSNLVRNIFLISLITISGTDLFAQVYEIDLVNGQTINTCSGTFYDSGNNLTLPGNYNNLENYTVTFCAPAGNTYNFNFTTFSLRNLDVLNIYDGPDASSPLIGSFTDLSLQGITIVSTGSCLTFNFISDASFTRPGWVASISCNSCPPISAPVILPSNPEACAGSAVTYSVDPHPGSTYTWTIDEGTPSGYSGNSNTLEVTWNLPGMTTGRVSVEETSSCGSTASSELFVDIYPIPSPVISGIADVCPNTPGVSYSTPNVPGNAYNWTVTGGTFTGSGNSILVNWGPAGIGTIQVTETDPMIGCSNITPLFTVMIQDIIPPLISGCPADININVVPGTCSNTASWVEPVAADVCSGAMTYTTRSHAPGSVFNSGTTTVTYTFTDAFGNTSTCSFDVTVTDNENPVAVCQNISVSLDAGGNAVITGSDIDNGSSDNCGIASLSVLPNTFNSTNIGPNNVILTVTDNSGNISTCNAVVTVLDNAPPVAICKNITVYLGAGGTVTITGADVDNGSNDPDGIASLVVAPNIFSCSEIGPNSVTLTVTDNAGKISTCSATVTVTDNINPVISCPGNLVLNTDPGVCGTIVNYIDPVGTDNCSGSITTRIAGMASGSLFPVGTTTNTFLVTDGSGNTATCSFTVTVSDNSAPLIILPAPPVIFAGPGCQAPVPAISATVTDNCTPAGSIIINQIPAAGTMIGTGITVVTITALDLSGNMATSNINVTVVDGIAPVITTPADITVNLDNSCQAIVPDFLGSLIVTDDCTAPGAIIKTQTPAAGTVIAGVSSTNILLEATDAGGNTGSVTVLFITKDIAPPVAVCRNTSLYLDGSGAATLTAAAVDNGSVDNCTSPLNFSLSRTAFNCSDIGAPVPVTLTVRDASLNTSTCISQVTVIDTVRPIVNVKAFNLVLGPGGSGTLLPSDVDNGSYDNCSAITLSVAPNTFNCGSQGTTIVTLTAVDAYGNSKSKSVSITISSTLNIDAVALSSCDLVGPFARYSSSVSGGNGTYSYYWDGLEDFVSPFVYFDFTPPFIHYANTSTAISPFFNNTMPNGIYHIRLVVTDGNGCRDTSELVLNKDAGLVFNNVSLKNSAACENEIKTYSVAAGATTYTWNITNGVFISPTNTNTVTVQWGSVSPGTLVATLTKPDLFGNPCTSSVSETVTINPLPVPAFNTPALSVCAGSDYTYTLTSAYSSHSWTVTNGSITGGGAAGDNFVTVKWGAFAAGTVSVSVTNANGCSDSVTANVTINGIPVPSLISSDPDNTFCAGTSVTFTAGGGNSYEFRVNGAIMQTGPSNIFTTTALANGQIVDVRVTNVSGCSAVSAGITNTVLDYPAATLLSSDADNRFCTGTSVTFTAAGGTNFEFRVGGLTAQTGPSPVYTTTTLLNGQVVDVIVTNAGGCSTTSAGITNFVDPLPLPVLTSSEPSNSFCTGTTVTFTAGGGILYNFRVNGISVQTGASTTFTTNTLTNGQTVDVIVTNAGSCSAASAGIINTVLPLPSATLISSDADNIICAGTSVTFTTGGGTLYTFRLNGANVQTGALNTYTTSSLSNGQVVDVVVTSAGGCSSTSAAITTTVTTPPSAAISYAGSPYCSTTGAGQAVTLTGASGGLYSVLPATGLTIDAVTGAINPSTSTPGAYTVIYTLPAAGGCGPVTTTAPVTITPVPVAAFNYVGSPYCANGTDPSPTFTGGGIAGTFSSSPAGLVFISTATGQVDLSASTPGSYVVTNTIAAGAGCGIVTATSGIIITAIPTASISYAASPYCNSVALPQPVTLTGTGVYTGGTFSSSPGLSINPITGAITPSASTPATYTVTYTLPAANGCAGIFATASVTINALPVAVISYAGSPYCNNIAVSQPVTLTGPAGGTFSSAPAGLTLDPSTGAIIPSTSASGAYIVTYTIPAGSGCPSVGVTAPVTITAAPTASVSYPGNPFCTSIVGTRPVSLNGTGAYSGGTFSSTAGLTIDGTSGAITPSSSTPGIYIVTYVTPVSGGCAPVTTTTSVTITALPAASISYGGAPFCSTVATAQPVTITGAGGGTFTSVPAGLTIDPVTGAITPSSSIPATYTVMYTIAAAGGCNLVSTTTNVTITALPTVTINYTGTPFCNSISTLQLVTINGTGDYLGGIFSSTAGLNIDPVSGQIDPSSSTPGNYIVTYSTVASGGCAAVLTTTFVDILAQPLPSFIIQPGANSCIGSDITYTTQPGQTNYVWIVAGVSGSDYLVSSGGTGPADNTVTLRWLTPGSKTVTVTYTSPSGCPGAGVASSATAVNPLPVPVITGPTPVCSGSTGNVYTTDAGMSNYIWSVTADGVITSGGGTGDNSVTVTWNSTVAQSVSVNYTDVNGCNAAASTVFNISGSPVNTVTLTSLPATTAQTVCINDPVTSITYSTTGATGATFTGLPAGVTGNWAADVITISGIPTASGLYSYTVTLTGGCGVVTTAGTISVTPLNAINLTSVAGTDNQTICLGSSITTITYSTSGATGANFIGFPAGMLVSWVSNTVTISGTPTAAGIFNYTVNLTGGCGVVSANGTINVSGNNTINLTSLPSTTTQTVCISTPITDITYSTTGATGATFASLPGGISGSWAANVVTISGIPTESGLFNYTVTLTGGCGVVSVNGTITVTPDNTIALTSPPATATQTVCNNTPITDITYSTVGATGAAITGLPGGVTGSWAANTVTISGIPAESGLFSYTVTLSGGCGVVTANGTINVTTDNTISLTSLPATAAQTVCVNTPVADITYNTVGATGATFAGLPSGVTGNWAADIVTISGTPDETGMFSYTVTLTGGCGVVTALGTITVTPDNTITLTSLPATTTQTVCINTPISDITYSTTGATGATFAGLPSGVTGVWAADAVTISGTPDESGPFSYIVTLTGGCGVVTAVGTITVTPDNTITLVSPPATITQTVCINTPITDISYSTAGATGATFAGLPAGVTGSWAADVVTINGIPNESGLFNYIVTLTGGCGIVTTSGTITVSPDNTVTLTSVAGTDNQEICLGSALTTITYATTGATGAIFAGLPAGMSFSFASNNITISGTPTAFGIFNYSVTLTGGCGSAVANGIITVNPDNSIALTSGAGTDNQATCINLPITEITYLTSGATGITFAGLPAGVTGSFAGNVVTISGTPSVNGVYNYTVTLTGGCGVASASGTIDVILSNSITLTSPPATTNQTVCSNAPVTDITYSTTGATGATFTGLPSGVSGTWAANTVTISGIPSVPGIFAYTVDLTGGCGSISEAGTITVNLSPSLVITDPAAVCSPLTVDLTAPQVTAGSTPALNFTYWTDALATVPYPTPAAASTGTYYIKGTDASGCYDIKAVNVIVNPSPSASMIITDVLCFGDNTGAVDLTVAGGTGTYSILWSNGAITEDISSLTAADYSVTITDANGCAINASGTVSEPVAPLSAITVVTNTSCTGTGDDGAVDLTVTGGTAPYTYLWSNGAITEDISGLVTGNYTVTITDANGCTAIASGDVISSASSISVLTTVTNVSCFGGNNGAVDLTVTGGTAPYSFLWSNGAVSEDISGLTPGNYSVVINDAGGCILNASGDVTEPAAPLAGSTAVTDLLCFGSNTGMVDLTVTGGTAPFTFLWNTGETTEDLSNVAAASYTVTITDANGCTAVATGDVTQPVAPLAAGTVITNILCNGGTSGAIDITTTGGTAPYTYLWNNSATTEDLSSLGAGSYNVKITDANGCFITVVADITQPAAMAIDETHTDAICPDEMNGSITITVTGGVSPYNVFWNDGLTTLTRAARDTTYTVVVTDANGCAESMDITVGFSAGSSCVTVPAVITPNGDGKNDTWQIKNIDLYPNAEVLVYSRWGKTMFKTKNISANPWDGMFNGKLVPTDSYHYILYLNDGSEPRTGTVTVIR